jgi:predicted transposase YdaD
MVVTILSYKFTTLNRVEVEAMLDIRFQETQVYKDVIQEGREEGRKEEALNLVLRQLSRRFQQKLSSKVRSQVMGLPLPVLEQLGDALLDFSSLADLTAWLVSQEEN